MSKLIIVSNRVPGPNAKAEAGGLAVALKQSLMDEGGTWIGWSGDITAEPKTHERIEGNVHYRTLDFTQADYDGFYTGLCNSMLWPLCHYRMDLCQFAPEMYESYNHVNQKYAEQVLAILKPNDIVWAHDYHLLLLAAHLRAKNVRQRIGFFMHIPFPVPEVLVALPNYQDILRGLTAYDVIGFQTESDLQSFLRCIVDLAKNPVIDQIDESIYEITAFGRNFRTGKFSISIDTHELMLAADRSEIDPQTIKLKESLGNRQMLIGVDRLDYTKGLIERLSAYQYFLENWPEYRGNVSYVQITPPSRTDVKDYGKIREQLESMAARVNGMNSEINWVPMRYINRSFTRNELAGFYRAARVGLVTPLRDGMNLVAKEYVASQNPSDPGVLLLSRFAGAADELKDGALLINPYNSGETAGEIHRALSMPLAERKERYQKMMTVLKREDIFLWTKRFLACLRGRHQKVSIGEPVRIQLRGRLQSYLGKLSHQVPALHDLIKNLSVAE